MKTKFARYLTTICILLFTFTTLLPTTRTAFAIAGTYGNLRLPYKGGTSISVTGDPSSHDKQRGISGSHAVDFGMYLADVYAMHAGRVEKYFWDNWGGGNVLVIDHMDGYCSIYAHLNRSNVNPGEIILQGQVVAQSGNTSKIVKDQSGKNVFVTVPYHLHASVTRKTGAVCSLAHSQEVAMIFIEKPGQELKYPDKILSQNFNKYTLNIRLQGNGNPVYLYRSVDASRPNYLQKGGYPGSNQYGQWYFTRVITSGTAYFTIKSVTNTSKCLTNNGNSNELAHILLENCISPIPTSQLWKIEISGDKFILTIQQSGKVLTYNYADFPTIPSVVIQRSRNAGWTQLWQVIPIP